MCTFTRALDKRAYLMIIFLISHRHYMLWPLIWTVRMRGHNIWFHAEFTKIIPNYHLELCFYHIILRRGNLVALSLVSLCYQENHLHIHVLVRSGVCVLFDVVVLFHLLAIADKIYGNYCAPWSVEILIKYAFPWKWGAIWGKFRRHTLQVNLIFNLTLKYIKRRL